MEKNHSEISYVLPILTVLLLVIFWALMGIFQKEQEPEMIKVSAIVEDSNNAKWTTFKQGLETAAKEENVDLSIVSSSTFSDVKEEWNLMDQKREDGAWGIILSPFNKEGMDDYYDALSWEISLCMVHTGIDGLMDHDNILSALPDYDYVADALMNQIKADYGENLSGKSVYLMSQHDHEAGTAYLFQRLDQDLRAAGCKIIGITSSQSSQKKLLKAKHQADILLALDDDSLDYAASTLAYKSENESRLYGVGISESCVYYLDKGLINGMVVSDDFNMGYESLKAVAQKIRNEYKKPSRIAIDSRAIRPEDVHNPEIEQILFPVIQ